MLNLQRVLFLGLKRKTTQGVKCQVPRTGNSTEIWDPHILLDIFHIVHFQI